MPSCAETAQPEPLTDGGDDDFNNSGDSHDDGNDDQHNEPDDRDDDGDDQPVDWVTVARFTDSTAVHLARIRLQAVDIPCLILDENLTSTLWHCALATGGIKLQVPREDAAVASELLETPTKSQLASRENAMKCPLCGSTEVVDEHLTLRRFLMTSVLILIGFAMSPLAGVAMLCCAACFIFFTPRRKCADCGRIWPYPAARGFDVEFKDKLSETSDAMPIANEIDHPR